MRVITPPRRLLRGAQHRGRVSRYASGSGAVKRREGANMCDQDHFDDDRLEFEARGMVTRRQFGVLLGAGVMMMLPTVANAVTVTESDVMVTTPDGTADCYFVHPASGAAAAVLI